MLRHVCVAVLVIPSVAVAQDFGAGMDAYMSGDYDRAAEVWTALAEQGDAEAQYELAYLYYSGLGVPEDWAEAARLFHLAADEVGLWHFQQDLAVLLAAGSEELRDPVAALAWFTIAAEAGSHDALKPLDKLSRDLLPDEVTRAEALARACVDSDFRACE